jgi:hypothetical protein
MKNKFWLVTFLVFSIQITEGFAQIGMMLGTNYSNIRHQDRLAGTRGKVGLNLGVNVEVVPIRSIPNLSLKTDFMIVPKGYNQILDDIKYRVNLQYFVFAPMIKYAFDKDFAVHSGVEFNGFIGSNVEGAEETYRKNEKAFFFGFDLLSSKRLSLYTRASFGLTPVLDYYEIDPIEGITGSFSDLYTTTIMLGLQLNIHHEKIRFKN